MSQPCISVIVAAKDAAPTVTRAISSALTDPAVARVILVDDGSTDATAEVARAIVDDSERVLVIERSDVGGPAVARNMALQRVETPLVAILDADDYVQPGRMSKLVNALGTADIVADDVLVADESDPEAVQGSLCDLPDGHEETLDLAGFVQGNIGQNDRRELGFLKPLIRMDALRALRPPAYNESLRLGEDYILYVRLLAARRTFRLVGPCGYVAVRRRTSLSGQHDTRDLHAFHQACLELVSLPGLTAAERAALKEHAVSVRRRYEHRRVLDVRRTQGLFPAVASLPSALGDVAYIVRETLASKLARWR